MDDDKMTDEALSTLKLLRAGAPSAEAKKLALNAAMVAFDAAQPKAAQPKRSWLNRWTLGAGLGVPLTTAVAALVLFPVATQLTATSNHLTGVSPKKETTVASVDAPVKTDDAKAKLGGDATSTLKLQTPPVVLEKPAAPPTTTATPKDAEGRIATSGTVQTEEAAPEMDQLATVAPAPEPMLRDMTVAPKQSAPMSANATALGGMAQPVPYQQSGDKFQKFDENRTKVTATDPVSTFSIDVDTASYSYVRSTLKDGYLPDPDAVRLEEMINYFPYDYPAPASLDTPFKATMAVIPTPWNPKTELLEIGIKGYVPPATERKPENLTFLIDTSGSMDEPNKLPLLKRSFGLLVDTLKPEDTVSIVVYAGSAGVVLEPTKASSKAKIMKALDNLSAGGSTAGAEGIALAYQMADENKLSDEEIATMMQGWPADQTKAVE